MKPALRIPMSIVPCPVLGFPPLRTGEKARPAPHRPGFAEFPQADDRVRGRAGLRSAKTSAGPHLIAALTGIAFPLIRSYLTSMSKKSYLSKITTKSQTVIPAAIRAKLGVGPGDQLRYVETEDGILIEKARVVEDDPFATFSEWATQADEKAYADL